MSDNSTALWVFGGLAAVSIMCGWPIAACIFGVLAFLAATV